MEEYKVQDKIGSGTYGDVFQVMKAGWDELKACKTFKRHYHNAAEAEEEIEVEFLWVAKHPNIIKVEEIIFD